MAIKRSYGIGQLLQGLKMLANLAITPDLLLQRFMTILKMASFMYRTQSTCKVTRITLYKKHVKDFAID